MPANWSGEPRTWISGDRPNHAILNAEVRDRMLWLKDQVTYADEATAVGGGATTGIMSSQSVKKYVDARLANNSDATTGSNASKLMTPQRVEEYVESRRADLATAQAGTNNTRLMTPQRTLELINAKRAFATKAEAEAGTASDKIMTPQRVKEAVEAMAGAQTVQTGGIHTVRGRPPSAGHWDVWDNEHTSNDRIITGVHWEPSYVVWDGTVSANYVAMAAYGSGTRIDINDRSWDGQLAIELYANDGDGGTAVTNVRLMMMVEETGYTTFDQGQDEYRKVRWYGRPAIPVLVPGDNRLGVKLWWYARNVSNGAAQQVWYDSNYDPSLLTVEWAEA